MTIQLSAVRPPRCLLVYVHAAETMECLSNPTQITEKVQVNWNRLAVHP